MIKLQGQYSFETFSAWLSEPANPIELAFSSGLEVENGDMQVTHILIPINRSHESPIFDFLAIPSIEFKLVNKVYSLQAKYVLIKVSDQICLIVSTHQNNVTDSPENTNAINQLSNFVESEFGVSKVFYLGDIQTMPQLTVGLNDFFGTKNSVSIEDLLKFFPKTVRVDPSSRRFLPDKILTAGPTISSLERAYVADATARGWNNNHSDYLEAFQQEFSNLVGSKFALATSSCTGALHLSLLALGIGPGDEVIVPDITWVATASAVMYVGAKPIFVDVDVNTWTIDVMQARAAITSKTKAIIPVHLYGFGANMNRIMALAKEFELAVIEDAAPAIGTRIEDRFAGTFGQFGCYSFQGAKLLVTGEGGMLVTDDEDLFERAKKIQDHGRRPGTFWIEELGHKYKMNNITAALGLAQIQRSQNQIRKKRQINEWYREGLSKIASISFQEEFSDSEAICWMTSIRISADANISRDDIALLLKSDGIDTRPVFPSISQYKIWGYSPDTPRNSKQIGDSGLNLPSGVNLNEVSVQKVIKSLSRILS
jgi:perosamine synthetase